MDLGEVLASEIAPRRDMDFGDALFLMRSGDKVTREGWNAPGQFTFVQHPTADSVIRRPFLCLSPVDGELVPWVPTQSDLLTEDWRRV